MNQNGWRRQVNSMLDDFKSVKTALAKLHQDMEAINRLARPSYPSLIERSKKVNGTIKARGL